MNLVSSDQEDPRIFMSTIKRESTLGKEKTGTSPSNSSTTHAAHGHGQRKPSTTSFEKQVPNYLKPTKSSRNDAAAAAIKNLKKPGPEDTSQTPNLLRRRSFDRPPSAARAHKALISPVRQKPSAAPVREKPTTSRSASFSSKFSTAPKATLEKVAPAKKPNAAKPQTLSSSRGIKKTPSPIPTTKRGLGNTSSASKKAPSSHDKKEAQNPETKHENKKYLDHLVEEVVQDDQGEIDDAEIPKAGESEHTDVVDTTEVKSVEEKGQQTADISSTFSQEHDVPQTEKVEDKIHEGKSDHTQHDEDKENHSKEEIIVGDDHQVEIPHEEAKTETEDRGEEHATDEVAATKEIEEEKQTESRQEDDEDEGSQQGLESNKEDMVEGVVEELEAEAANVVAETQVQAGREKKESATPYNDVIEETASKLLEERKNKVRALVGAFETVIDKETSNAK